MGSSLPIPSIDRPFGIHLWSLFDQAFTMVMGFHPQDFDFKPHQTPLSTMREAGFSILAYYIIVFGGRELMRKRPAFKLNGPFMIHNFYLTAISAILLALFIEQLVPTIWRHGLFYSICDSNGGWTRQMVILYYVRICRALCGIMANSVQLNYLTKYLELLDTVFLVLKKKPLSKIAFRIDLLPTY